MNVICYLDNLYLDTFADNVPGSSGGGYLKVVNSLQDHAKQIQVFNASLGIIGLYTGGAGEPRDLIAIIFPQTQPYYCQVNIPKGTRLSLKSLRPIIVNSGLISLMFIG